VTHKEEGGMNMSEALGGKWSKTQRVTITIPAEEPVRDTYEDGYLDALADVGRLIERVLNSRDPVREGRALLFARTQRPS